MLAYVFPGQGAQFKGMGRDLFDEFSELIKKADHILRILHKGFMPFR